MPPYGQLSGSSEAQVAPYLATTLGVLLRILARYSAPACATCRFKFLILTTSVDALVLERLLRWLPHDTEEVEPVGELIGCQLAR